MKTMDEIYSKKRQTRNITLPVHEGVGDHPNLVHMVSALSL